MINIKNRFSIGKLFYNDKFVIIFSVFLAFMFWVFAVSTSQDTSYLMINDIPVSAPELSDELQVFGIDNLTASVRVSGNALVIQSMSANDIYITASNTDELTEIGKKTMKLTAKKSGVKTDYEFASTVSPAKVDVYVDRYVSREIPITENVKFNNIDSSLYVSQSVLSQSTVTVQGAESYVNKIAEVRAEEEVNETLSATKKITDVPLAFYDANGERVDQTYLTFNITSVDVTVPVYQVHEIDVKPNIINIPSSLEFDESLISVEPSTGDIVFLDENNAVDTIYTEEIDFTKLNLENNTFKSNLVIPTGAKDINSVGSVTVKFDTSDMTQRTIAVNKFEVIGQSSDKVTKVTTKSINVTVIGPTSQVSSISSGNITAVVDMSESNASSSQYSEEPVTFGINLKFSECWVYGSYQVDVVTSNASEVSESSA